LSLLIKNLEKMMNKWKNNFNLINEEYSKRNFGVISKAGIGECREKNQNQSSSLWFLFFGISTEPLCLWRFLTTLSDFFSMMKSAYFIIKSGNVLSDKLIAQYERKTALLRV